MRLSSSWWNTVKDWVTNATAPNPVEYRIWTKEEHTHCRNICHALNMDPLYLGAVMHHESGFRSDLTTNRSSGAGLIMWLSDPKGLYFGLTKDQFLKTGVTFQLNKIHARYRNYLNQIGDDRWSLGWAYAVVALPVGVGMPDDYVIVDKNGSGKPYNEKRFYAANPTWDPEGTGQITPKSLELCIRIHAGGPKWQQWVLENSGYKSNWPDLVTDSRAYIKQLGFPTVAQFQQSKGLVPDGIIGMKTKAAILRSLDALK